jgi:general secretion pathway protein L
MTTSTLAIDIQHEQVISVLLNHGLKGIQVMDSASFPISGKQTEDDAFFTATANALQQISASMENNFDRCVISIPASRFLFRTLELPFKSRKKIEQIIPFELENYLPFQTGAFGFDFCILKKNKKTASGTHMVSVATIGREILSQYISLFNDSGLSPDGVTVGSGYAMALVFAGTTDPADVSMFVYAEPLSAAAYIIRSGQIAFCRSFVLDPDDPESAVEKNLMHTHLFFNERFKNRTAVNDIAISGTAAFLDRLGKNIETRMQVKVQVFNVFETLKVAPMSQDFGTLDHDRTQNAIAMAANDTRGVDGYNFTRQLSDFAEFYQEHKADLISSIVLVVMLLLAWSVQPVLNINVMEKRSQDLDKRIVQVFQSCFPDIKTIVDPVQQMQIQVQALQKEKSMDFTGEHLLNIDVLNGISNMLPSEMDIVITRFVRIENNLLLSGSADQFNTIDRMKSFFEDIAIFNDVDINSASMDKIDNRVKFSLKILL